MIKNMIKIVAMGLAITFLLTGCTSDDIKEAHKKADILASDADDSIKEAQKGVEENDLCGPMAPFKRIAILYPIKDANGDIDWSASQDKAHTYANNLALYITKYNEAKENNTTFTHGDWTVNGYRANSNATEKDVKGHVLAVPTFDITDTFSKKTNMTYVVEMINQDLAKIVLGQNENIHVNNGKYRATTLPCSEVSIYIDPADGYIYIDILNASGLLALFNPDLLFENSNNATFIKNIKDLNTEVITIVYNWIKACDQIVIAKGASTEENDERFIQTDILMGPIYASKTKVRDLPTQAGSPFAHYTYEANKDLTGKDIKQIAESISQVFTVHGGKHPGQHEAALQKQINKAENSKGKMVYPGWRNARHNPFPLPGDIEVIEACSPFYAKNALSTGNHHSPALPCEIAFFVDPNDAKKLTVSFLRVGFMFNALFSDAISDMSDEQKEQFGKITTNIKEDLETIVDYALENNVSMINSKTKTEIIL